LPHANQLPWDAWRTKIFKGTSVNARTPSHRDDQKSLRKKMNKGVARKASGGLVTKGVIKKVRGTGGQPKVAEGYLNEKTQ